MTTKNLLLSSSIKAALGSPEAASTPALILPTELVMKNQEDSLYKARERKVVEAICRVTGRTDYETNTLQNMAQECEVESEFYKRGRWKCYDDGSEVFFFDGKELLYFGPVMSHGGQLVQESRELYNKIELRDHHHTKEEERG